MESRARRVLKAEVARILAYCQPGQRGHAEHAGATSMALNVDINDMEWGCTQF